MPMHAQPMKQDKETDALPAEGLARLPAVLRVVGYSRSTWMRLVREGHAPAPVRLGPSGHLTAWRVQEIREWINRQQKVVSRIDDRRTNKYPFAQRALKREEVCSGAA